MAALYAVIVVIITITIFFQYFSEQDQTWPSVAKSDSASDAGDDASSVKSGSVNLNIGNLTTQDSTTTAATGALSTNSSSPWSTTAPLPGMESNPWGNTNSPAPSSLGTIGWSNPPSSLSLSSNNQGLQNMQPGSSNSSISFNCAIGNNTSSGWPTGIVSNPSSATSMPPNMNSGLQSGTIPSQWQGSSMLGNIGDFSKTEPNWNNSTSSVLDSTMNKENNPDLRMWGLGPDKLADQWGDATQKSQWSNSPIGPAGDQGAGGNSELSFAQATLKGLKTTPAANLPQSTASIRNDEMLRAIENHEGWGSRPVRQDTHWDIDASPKSNRKFSMDSNQQGASNVWNNSNGTAIWEAVRVNQNSDWQGTSVSGNSWNGDKDQSNWGVLPKTPQDNWGATGVGSTTDSKSFGMWGGSKAGGDAGIKMWGQKPDMGSWDSGKSNRPNPSAWGDDADPNTWDHRRAQGGMPGMVPPSPGISGVLPQGVPGMNNMSGISTDNSQWNDAQKTGWMQQNNPGIPRPKLDEPWNKPPPKISGWGDPVPDGPSADDGTGLWASNVPKQVLSPFCMF